MQALKQFSLPIHGMKIGFHDFTFELTPAFFEAFENAPISESRVTANMNVERKTDHMVLDIKMMGKVLTECNRCTDEINFPIFSDSEFLVKFDQENPREEEEIIYLEPGAQEFNCAKILYDLVILAIPMVTTCDAVDNKTCNKEVLDRLYQHKGTEKIEEEVEDDNPFSKALKNLKLN